MIGQRNFALFRIATISLFYFQLLLTLAILKIQKNTECLKVCFDCRTYGAVFVLVWIGVITAITAVKIAAGPVVAVIAISITFGLGIASLLAFAFLLEK